MIDQKYTPNPDADRINKKQSIDVNYLSTDLTSSVYDYTGLVKLNYTQTETILYNYSGSVNEPGYVYYMPMYTENINYEQWKQKINKSFAELGNI